MKGLSFSLTVGQIQKFLGGGDICGHGDVTLLSLGDLEELASQWVGVAVGADTEGQLRFGGHIDGGVGGVSIEVGRGSEVWGWELCTQLY